MGGVNLVAGFRPELWRGAAPSDSPSGVIGFNREVVGPDGFVLPATQHDAVLWLSGSAYVVHMPFGTVTRHGTMFVGFSADQERLSAMLASMVGLADGPRDALTYYTRVVSGSYYFVPSNEALRRYVATED